MLDDAAYAQARLTLPATTGCCSTATGWSSGGAATSPPAWSRLRVGRRLGARAEPHQLLDDVLAAMDPPDADDVTLLAVARTAT